jgi:hypothetical protein
MSLVGHHAYHTIHQASDPTTITSKTPVVTDDATIAIHSYNPVTSFVVEYPKKSPYPGMPFLEGMNHVHHCAVDHLLPGFTGSVCTILLH